MSYWSRTKSDQGGRAPFSVPQFTGTGDWAIPDFTNSFIVDAASGGATISTINATGRIMPGRVIRVRGKNGMSGVVTFTSSALTTTRGAIDCLTSASSRTLGDNEEIEFQQHSNGAWSQVNNQGPNNP